MPRFVFATAGCITTGLAVSGCATAPVQTAAGYASAGAHGAYGVASTSAHAVYTTGGDVYSGVGQAARQPLHDLNMMQDPIPVVLLRTESKPYDLTGVNSCEAVLDQVAELDLALGPDLDSPKDRGRNRTTRGADAAASAALLAAADAADHFIPMRSVIKEVSGATRYENHVKHAVLAGTVRRAFLKAIGMSHNCGWPASPLVFNAAQVAVVSGVWTAPGSLQAVAVAATAPLAVPPVATAYPQTVTVAALSRTAVPATSAVAMVSTTQAAVRPTIVRQVLVSQSMTDRTTPSLYAARQPVPIKTASLTLRSAPPQASVPAFMPRAVKVTSADPSTADAFASSSQPAFVSPAAPAPPWSIQAQSRP